MVSNILILGAGITGLTSAIALHKYLPSPKPRVTIYELRSSPSTIGGAVNLTPKAVRYLDHLGVHSITRTGKIGAECQTIEIYDVYSGSKYAELDFRGKEGKGIGAGKDGEGKFFARRVMRSELQGALLEVVKSLPGAEVVFGKKALEIEEGADGVTLRFEDGESVSGDCLLGCDGIHSATRTLLVDLERKPTYTGISVAMATASLSSSAPAPPWTTTGLVNSRRGSLMSSYFNPSSHPQQQQLYVGAVLEVADVGSREGWKVRGADQDAIKQDLLTRFASKAMPVCEAILEAVGEWTLYPVFMLPEGGKWRSKGGRVVLLGDAAHAMPPQGESTGICIEDAIVLSRAMMQHPQKPISPLLQAYEHFRRPYTDRMVKEATWRFETVKDKGWLAYQILMRATPWFLWWTANKREEEFSDDLSETNLTIAE